MVCTPTNAYPNNNCVDGNNYQFKITFNGDFCQVAYFDVYDYNTGAKLHHYHDSGVTTNGFHNGEEIDIKHTNKLSQDGEYVWRSTFFEKIDTENGYYPDVFSSDGEIQKNPLTKVTVINPGFELNMDSVFIPIESELDVTLPCYVYWAGHGRKLVVNYQKEKGVLKLDSMFDSVPEIGTELYLSTVKIKSVDSIVSETGLIPVEMGLQIDTGTHQDITSSADIPNTYIKINDNYHGITKYYSKTGLLGIDGSVPEYEEGTKYQIYQSFVKSPYYYFTTKAVPVVIPTMTFTNEVIKCEASIITAGKYPVKYFYWTIYNKDGKIINQSEKIYSGRLEYLFRELQTNTTFTGKITIVTQDNVEVSSDTVSCTIPNGAVGITDLKAMLDKDKNTVKLTWKNADGVSPTSYIIQRIDPDGTQRYLETLQTKAATSFIDYTCGNGMKYTYIVIPVTLNIVYQQATVSINTDYNGYTIYFITDVPYERPSTSITDVRIYYNYMYGDKQFQVTSIWKIDISPEISGITHNIKRDKSDTLRGKPVVTYGNMNYDTIPLKFTFGNLSCPNNDIINGDYITFQRWKNDINSKLPVLLKDISGNVWFGAITEHTYTPDYGEYKLYDIEILVEQTRDMYADNQTKTRILST